VSSSEPLLEVRGLGAAWHRSSVLDDISFDVAPGELLVLMGPNGSGKSTLLRCLAGLERPTGGTIRLGGRSLNGVPVHRRGIGMLLQDAELFPGRTVRENIAYAPLLQRLALAEVHARVDSVARLLELVDLLDRPPAALSGGERQRVALARTLAARPSLVLLDEPFASIDAELRTALRSDFRAVLRQVGLAAVHVTHDREEGLFLGDRVAVLLGGRLRQIDSPDRLFDAPRDAAVARFLGYNLLRQGGELVAVLPRDLRWSTNGSDGVLATVVARGYTPDGDVAELRSDAGERVELRPERGVPAPPIGSTVRLTWGRARRLPEDVGN
jgi:ABC-type sugar transport system ATPase subunit